MSSKGKRGTTNPASVRPGGGGAGPADARAQAAEERAALHAQLKRLIATERYGELVRVCRKAAGPVAQDPVVGQVLVVALIRQEDYEGALRVIVDRKASASLAYERAYCLYRLNRLDEADAALAELGDVATSERRCALLRAQVLYRLERFEECLNVYNNILVNMAEDDTDYQDVMVNVQAVRASLQLARDRSPAHGDFAVTDLEETLDSFEMYEACYNYACMALAHGQPHVAIRALEHARRITNETFPSPRDKDILHRELLPVLTQLAYAYQVTGQTARALDLYKFVLALSDARKQADWVVANNNLLSIQGLTGHTQMYDVIKRLKAVVKVMLQQRVPDWQRHRILLNQSLAAIVLQKAAESKQEDSEYLQVLEAFQALSLGNEVHVKDPPSLLAIFCRLQELWGRGQLSESLSVAESALRAYPHVDGLRAFCARVRLALGHPVDDAVAALQTAGTREARARLLASVERHREASTVLAELWKEDPSNSDRLAEFLTSLALVDADEAEQLAAALPEVPERDTAVEQEHQRPGSAAPEVTKEAGADTDKAKQKKKKKRKPRLPKAYDPNVQPDPDRWLPKRLKDPAFQRHLAKKNKKAKAQGGGAHQGGTVDNDTIPAPEMTGIGGTGSANIFGKSRAPANKPAGGQAKKKLAKGKGKAKK